MSATENREVRRRKGSGHDKTGCLTCRHRRKKCVDNTFPVCGACRRLNLECVREPVRRVVPVARPKDEAQAAIAPETPAAFPVFPPASQPQSPMFSNMLPPPPPPPPLVPSFMPVETPQRRQAMRYYITVLAHHLSVSQEFNSFLSAFLPMAFDSAVFSDALMAFATGHLSQVDNTFTVAALEARSAAMRSLATSINTPTAQVSWHETNAAACLALLVCEVTVGDGKGWYTHLKGTKHIIHSAAARTGSGKLLRGPEAFKNSSEGRWILRNFAYHDIIGCVTMQKRPLLDGRYLDDITDEVDSYVGVATGLLRFIAEISCLDDDTKPGVGVGVARERNARLHSSCARLELQLQSWTCHADTSPGLAAVAYAYRGAALILLYRLARSRLDAGSDAGPGADSRPNGTPPATADLQGVLQSKIETQVSETLASISRVPVGDAPESAILFPLFIAGGELTDEADIEAVRSRLRTTLEKRRFQNISLALDVLEDLWDLRQRQGGISADWPQILDTSRGQLVLT